MPITTEKGEYTVYGRAYTEDRRLIREDIKEALSYFKVKRGKTAAVMVLNPRYQGREFENELPPGVTLEYRDTVMGFEIWLASQAGGDNFQYESRFNIRAELEALQKGGVFWCKACCTTRPLSEQSSDSRYCQYCYDVLASEASLLMKTKSRPAWMPKPAKHMDDRQEAGEKVIPREIVHKGVLLPINATSNKTIATPAIRPKSNKGGRPRQTLPMDKILELHNAGVGVKTIGRQLGFSGMTVSRALVGVKE